MRARDSVTVCPARANQGARVTTVTTNTSKGEASKARELRGGKRGRPQTVRRPTPSKRWGGKTPSTAIATRDLAKAREKGLSQTRPTGDTAYALRASRDAKIKAAESGEICGDPAVRQPLRPFRINANQMLGCTARATHALEIDLKGTCQARYARSTTTTPTNESE